MWQNFEVLVVGAGLSGAVLAERYANLGKKVLILEKRPHIGGNCYDEVNSDDIRVSKYGAHIFHTNDEVVHCYIHQFSEWVPYEHRVLAKVGKRFVPMPVNILTINALFDTQLKTADDMSRWLQSQTKQYNRDPKSSEELGLSRFGKKLYEKLFLPYTQKQWDKHPRDLNASVVGRIPVRLNTDDRYFTDKHQYLPKHGYTPFFEKLLSHRNITVLLNCDYFDVRDRRKNPFEKVFYTGPIDRFFDFQKKLGETLEYRSLRFEHEWHEVSSPEKYSQPVAVVNHPSLKTPFTRSIEYKHFSRAVDPSAVQHLRTIVVKEYSTSVGEPYYPIPNEKNQLLYEKYKKEADKLSAQGIYFVGRLANYKYFNMDEAIKNALELFNQLEQD